MSNKLFNKTSFFSLYFTVIFDLLGNGTLNKQAGIDYKQLSLLAKINENQSGEVSCPLFKTILRRLNSFNPKLILCRFYHSLTESL